jgi:hypothetical protein
MHHAFCPPDFDPDFASPADWACMYRTLGLQVIPSWIPGETTGPWKRPKLSEWTEYHHKLAPQTTFDRWYAPGGEHVTRDNLGIVTGEASGNVFVLDFDDHKGPQADQWWRGLISVENNNINPETAEQQTGGGGRQKLFRAPTNYHVPTNRTSLGIDIRGQAGFAVMPASLHESGRHYQWAPGCAPWEIPIAIAEPWLLDAVEALAGAYGGDQGSTPHEHTASPGSDYDGFGNVQDGREKVMRDVVWRAVLELYRQSPIPPPIEVWLPAAEKAYEVYERRVTSRIVGVSKFEGLEREGRGPTAFRQKWRATLRHWGSPRMVAEAAKPNPKPKDEPPPQPPPINPKTGQPLPLLLNAEQFIDGFTPPAYLIDGILQRGYLYSLTARTGHGKTAVAMYVAQCVARAENMHGRAVKQGTVLLLAGENPDDIRARFLVLGEAYGFVPEQLKMRFIAGVVNIATRMVEIRAEADAIDDLVLVIVDTAAAYFPGDETNSNSQQGAYARLLRELTFLHGKPAVLVNCHPIKNAAQDNLLPMGGSAFLNEVDGNLTLWADAERQVSLHWLGKFRGPEFEPLAFELRMADSVRVHDADGRLMPSVVAVPVADLTMEEGRRKLENDENRVLKIMAASPNATFEQIAVRCGFVNEGRPSRSKVQRIIKSLLEFSFVSKHRNGKYKLTKKGETEIGSGAFG